MRANRVLRMERADANFRSFKLKNDETAALPTRLQSELTDNTMKTAGALLGAALFTVCGSALAQTRYGTVFLNNYDSGKGLFDVLCGEPARVDTMVEVLGGSTPNTLFPIATAI